MCTARTALSNRVFTTLNVVTKDALNQTTGATINQRVAIAERALPITFSEDS